MNLFTANRCDDDNCIKLTQTDMSLSTKVNIRLESSAISPPTTMSLIKLASSPGFPVSVNSDEDNIYVGQCGYDNLLRYNLDLSGRRVFVRSSSSVASTQTYKDELFVWLADIDRINVYDLDGKLKRSWEHYLFKTVRVLSNKVVALDNHALRVFDLQGQPVKQIECPGISSCRVKAMAVAGDGSVIISNFRSGKVFRVNVDSGEVM